jgi:AcrR family transcriptional regulator
VPGLRVIGRVSTGGDELSDDGPMPRAAADSEPSSDPRRRRGPRRSADAPRGPEEVGEAVLEAAAGLFGERGVVHVSLRDIAGAANVQLALIARYVGNRAELIDEVFRRVSAQAVAELEARPLQQLEYGRGSIMGRWLALLNHYVIAGQDLPVVDDNPVRAMAEILERNYGLDHPTATIRAAQVTASAIGWRIFEDFLVASAGLGHLDLSDLRDDLTAIQRRVGSTPWPTPVVDPAPP